MRTVNKTQGILFLAVLATVLTGCSGETTAGPSATRTATTPSPDTSTSPTAVATTSASPTPTDTPTPTPTCGPSTAAAAVDGPISELRLPAGLEDAKWDAANADVSGYDPCAPLSWVVVSLERATGSSPFAIVLLHEGRYLGTATKVQYSFVPDVRRTDPSTIAVTYHYAKPGEATADASGRTNATYTWDAAAGRVVMSGETPPVG